MISVRAGKLATSLHPAGRMRGELPGATVRGDAALTGCGSVSPGVPVGAGDICKEAA
jgi:hypothetical protein